MTNQHKITREIIKEQQRTGTLLLVVVLLLESIFLFTSYKSTEKQIKTEAKAHAEEIASTINAELNNAYETTELLKDLHQVYGDVFLQDFDRICEELTRDNLAIGSMYFAPKGIIKYSYPHTVDNATSDFEMIKDPIQGPKAQKAVNDKLPTIAGPHHLVEGGEGFIVRTPIFKDNDFIGFSIIVIDKQILIDQIQKKNKYQAFRFAVWKNEDPTAVLDANGFILSSDNKPVSRDIQTSFNVLNDIWYICLEPKDGWNVWGSMKIPVAISLIVLLILSFFYYMQLLSWRRKRQLQMERLSNKAKSQFLFSMSHDIRTPMNAIIGFSELMKKNLDDKEKLVDYLNKINASSSFLLSLINNVLEMARIESGKVTLDENMINTQKFEDITEAVFTDQARNKGIQFSNNYHLIHEYVIGDEMKVRELTLNIISNAIKYTPAGGYVKLSLIESENKKPGYTTFTAICEDSGIGISKEYLPHIFDEFSRERNSTDSKISGTGLGMPIVKRLLNLMNGTIDIESEVGKGTKITIVLPLRLPTEEQMAAARQAETQSHGNTIHTEMLNRAPVSDKIFNGHRILLAEDNDLNAEIAIAILEEMGFIVERVSDGIQCVQTLSRQDNGFFDVILMDIQMPNMDGYTATRSIRTINDHKKSDIPIIAMTANAFEEDREKAFEAGMNDHISKPIDANKLAIALEKVIKI
ncbi:MULTISPECIES: response regulator [unclassified Fibrobacter]|uniref:hybrid sensor histidine kinase/response regulator n=1 Tax=unclassified Fibrobacter TaxID=2634177 RepID=UPI000D6B296A|nr:MULTISPECIES: response regulator [unclassified Fibrobacter]PWJ59105.1 signal transduction histidine kinase [Fibrobacter sp. UWR4]PZW62966.1 signal transduction histidine kinase [Fibrobacter sp. UWR1]